MRGENGVNVEASFALETGDIETKGSVCINIGAGIFTQYVKCETTFLKMFCGFFFEYATCVDLC